MIRSGSGDGAAGRPRGPRRLASVAVAGPTSSSPDQAAARGATSSRRPRTAAAPRAAPARSRSPTRSRPQPLPDRGPAAHPARPPPAAATGATSRRAATTGAAPPQPTPPETYGPDGYAPATRTSTATRCTTGRRPATNPTATTASEPRRDDRARGPGGHRPTSARRAAPQFPKKLTVTRVAALRGRQLTGNAVARVPPRGERRRRRQVRPDRAHLRDDAELRERRGDGRRARQHAVLLRRQRRLVQGQGRALPADHGRAVRVARAGDRPGAGPHPARPPARDVRRVGRRRR